MKLVPDLIREMQSLSEQLKDGYPLFSGSGNSSPDGTESLRSFSSSEAVCDFLIQFNHYDDFHSLDQERIHCLQARL